MKPNMANIDDPANETAVQNALARRLWLLPVPPLVTRGLPEDLRDDLSMMLRQPLPGPTQTTLIGTRAAGEYYRIGRIEGDPWFPVRTTIMRLANRSCRVIAVHEDGDKMLVVTATDGRTRGTTAVVSGFADFYYVQTSTDMSCRQISEPLTNAQAAALATRLASLERYAGLTGNEPVPSGTAPTPESLKLVEDRLKLLEHTVGITRTDDVPFRNPMQGNEARLAAFELLHGVGRRSPVPTTLPTGADPAATARLLAFEAASGTHPPAPVPTRLVDPAPLERRIGQFETAAGIAPGQAVPPRLVVPGTDQGGGSTGGGDSRVPPTGSLPVDDETYQQVVTRIITGPEEAPRAETRQFRGRFLNGMVPTNVLGARIRWRRLPGAESISWTFGTLHVEMRSGSFDTVSALTTLPQHLLLAINQQQNVFSFSNGGLV